MGHALEQGCRLAPVPRLSLDAWGQHGGPVLGAQAQMETVLTSGAVSHERERSKPVLAGEGYPGPPPARGGWGLTPAVPGAPGQKEFAGSVSTLFLIFPFLRLSHMACADTSHPGKLSSS